MFYQVQKAAWRGSCRNGKRRSGESKQDFTDEKLERKNRKKVEIRWFSQDIKWPLGRGKEKQSQLAEAKETREGEDWWSKVSEGAGRNRLKGLHSLQLLSLISGWPRVTHNQGAGLLTLNADGFLLVWARLIWCLNINLSKRRIFIFYVAIVRSKKGAKIVEERKMGDIFLDLWGQLAVMAVITSPEVISPEPQPVLNGGQRKVGPQPLRLILSPSESWTPGSPKRGMLVSLENT